MGRIEVGRKVPMAEVIDELEATSDSATAGRNKVRRRPLACRNPSLFACQSDDALTLGRIPVIHGA
jgi:hypothetical protein